MSTPLFASVSHTPRWLNTLQCMGARRDIGEQLIDVERGFDDEADLAGMA